MNKILVGAISVVLVTSGLWFGSTLVIANSIETKMTQDTQKAFEKLSPLVKLESIDYQKGLTSATRTMKVRVGNDATTEPMVWRDHVQYGPFPDFNQLAMATVDSGFVLTEQQQESLKKELGLNVAPLRVQTKVSFDQAFVSEATIPSLDARMSDGSFLRWQGLMLKWVTQEDKVDISIQAPLLEFSEPETQTSIKIVGYQSQGHYKNGGYWWLYTGNSETKVESIAMTSQQQLGSEYAPTTVEMKRLLNNTTTKLVDNLLSSSGQFSLDFQADNYRVDGFMIHDSVNRIHAPTLDGIVNTLSSPPVLQSFAATNGDADALEKAMKDASVQFAKLLPFNPEYSLDKVAFSLDGAQGQLSFSVGVNGVTDADINNQDPSYLLAKIVAKATSKVPNAWIKSLMLNDLSEDERKAVSEEEVQEILNATLGQLVEAGYVTQEGSFLISKASLQNGIVELNGEKVPLLDIVAAQSAE